MPLKYVYSCLSIITLYSLAHDQQLLHTLTNAIQLPASSLEQLNALVQPSSLPAVTIAKRTDNYPLYQHYPALEAIIPSRQLCQLPTPAHRLSKASKALGINLYIKRDDLSNNVYGGNKNRTLEFFIADAQRMHATALATVGSAGSTHAVATTHMARATGFDHCYTALVPHPNSHEVQQLLLLLQQYGATMRFFPCTAAQERGLADIFVQHKKTYGTFPYFIPSGGSTPLGIIGYVNAMFELKQQIQQGLIPEPDYLYVACGSKGTSAGLLLGAKAAGLKSIIVPVCIKKPANPKTTYADAICQLSRDARDLICAADPTFPNYSIDTSDLPRIHDCSGVEYGVFTPEGNAAQKFLYNKEKITLDGTYTAKAFSALMQDAKKGLLKGKKVLFWLTYCSEAVITDHDYTTLPPEAQRYFSPLSSRTGAGTPNFN